MSADSAETKKILVTGAEGFMGRNLIEALSRRSGLEILRFDVADNPADLATLVTRADLIFHLAGVNRPQNPADFEDVNRGLTVHIVRTLVGAGRRTPIVLSSSTQAALDNPYGISKKEAEEAIFEYGRSTGADVYVYRLTNVFGKWSRPNYNSVVSTFCHNIAHDLPIQISDENREVELVYIDDVVKAFVDVLGGTVAPSRDFHLTVTPTYRLTLRELADTIYGFRRSRDTLVMPDLGTAVVRCLYATYLSYLEPDNFSYTLETKPDERGCLAELIKAKNFGQIFVSRTRPGITRGNHYHNTKVEKFCVLEGKGIIRFRHILSDEVVPYSVSGEQWQVVDIPPGYTHSIENIGDSEMIVLFWADEVFDPEKPDTYFLKVLPDE